MADQESFLKGKLSDAVRIAADDLLKVANDPRYIVDMSQYHSIPEGEVRCHVCLAGSALAKTCAFPYRAKYAFSASYEDEEPLGRALRALDCVRLGNLSLAISLWPGEGGGDRPSGVPSFGTVVTYHFNRCRIAFISEVILRADILEQHGY